MADDITTAALETVRRNSEGMATALLGAVDTKGYVLPDHDRVMEAMAEVRVALSTIEAEIDEMRVALSRLSTPKDETDLTFHELQDLWEAGQPVEFTTAPIGKARRLSTPTEPDNIVATGWMEPFPTTPKPSEQREVKQVKCPDLPGHETHSPPCGMLYDSWLADYRQHVANIDAAYRAVSRSRLTMDDTMSDHMMDGGGADRCAKTITLQQEVTIIEGPSVGKHMMANVIVTCNLKVGHIKRHAFRWTEDWDPEG